MLKKYGKVSFLQNKNRLILENRTYLQKALWFNLEFRTVGDKCLKLFLGTSDK